MSGAARVTELGEGGSVPELRFENLGQRPGLLLDGEVLVGAKQNRRTRHVFESSGGQGGSGFFLDGKER